MNNYYNENAEEFFNGTVNVDMSPNYVDFLDKIPENGRILDAGCGSGRDTLIFKEKGYDVTAIDGSIEMCKLASEYCKQDVLHMQFQEIEFVNEFDGIWASSSLLHVASDEILDVLERLKNSLKDNGVMYASFKYGEYEGERNGRYFNDFTEKSVEKLFNKASFKIKKIWITADARPERQDEKWVNVLVNKKN